MDYLIVHSAEAELPSPRASFWQQVSHFFKTFFASFLEDYNTVGDSGSEEGITVWANIGRDQIQVIKNLVVDQFTPQTGIDVTLSVVQTGFIEATLAGRGPDVAIGMARGQPVNLACRNALLPFDSYEGFENMKKRFADTALVPYQYNGQTYGIPCTQTFFMMFYRKDILAEMGIAVPQTWTDIMETVPKLQRSHMTIGLPYAVISAATAVEPKTYLPPSCCKTAALSTTRINLPQHLTARPPCLPSKLGAIFTPNTALTWYTTFILGFRPARCPSGLPPTRCLTP